MNIKKCLTVFIFVLLSVSIFLPGVASSKEIFDDPGREEHELRLKIDGSGIVNYDPDAEDINELEEEWIFTYRNGTEIILFAEPRENWEFVEWRGDKEGKERNITFHIEEDIEITAVFENDVIEPESTPGFKSPSIIIAVMISITIFEKLRTLKIRE